MLVFDNAKGKMVDDRHSLTQLIGRALVPVGASRFSTTVVPVPLGVSVYDQIVLFSVIRNAMDLLGAKSTTFAAAGPIRCMPQAGSTA